MAHLIFDLDGTLVDSSPGILETLEEAIRQVLPGQRFDPAAVSIGPPVRVMARQVLPLAAESDLDAIEQAFRRRYDSQGWRSSRLYPGVIETLSGLQQAGHRLYLATNKPALPTGQIVAHLHLDRFFDAVVCSDSVHPPYATKASMLQALIDGIGLAPPQVFYIGDGLLDLQASMECGVHFVGVEYGYGDFSGQQGIVFTVSTFSSLVQVIIGELSGNPGLPTRSNFRPEVL